MSPKCYQIVFMSSIFVSALGLNLGNSSLTKANDQNILMIDLPSLGLLGKRSQVSSPAL
jgi:hypothetical protein